MTSGEVNKVIFFGKHEVSGSNEGSTTFLRQLPVLTGNDSLVRKSDMTTISFSPNYIYSEILKSYARLLKKLALTYTDPSYIIYQH